LKNAGNPKDSRRRFQVALYSTEKINAPIACSESMFVHNNSKHGRRQPSFREAVVGDGKPYIITVYPSEGWTTGGTKVCIVRINFYEGIEVVFVTLPAICEVCIGERGSGKRREKSDLVHLPQGGHPIYCTAG